MYSALRTSSNSNIIRFTPRRGFLSRAAKHRDQHHGTDMTGLHGPLSTGAPNRSATISTKIELDYAGGPRCASVGKYNVMVPLPVTRSGRAVSREPASSRSAPGRGYRTLPEFDVASRAFVRPPEHCCAGPLAAAQGRHSGPRECGQYRENRTARG